MVASVHANVEEREEHTHTADAKKKSLHTHTVGLIMLWSSFSVRLRSLLVGDQDEEVGVAAPSFSPEHQSGSTDAVHAEEAAIPHQDYEAGTNPSASAVAANCGLLFMLPPELLVEIVAFCDAPSLLSVRRVCSLLCSLEAEHEARLWAQLLATDFPAFPPSGPWHYPDVVVGGQHNWYISDKDVEPHAEPSRRPRQAYILAHQGSEFELQLINPELQKGTFGGAIWTTAKYRRAVGRPGVDHPECCTRLWVKTSTANAVGAGKISPTPHGRVRRPAGSKRFKAACAPFDVALRRGMAVEVQWKRTVGARRYNYWFAIVRRVIDADSVELLFPQYMRNPSAGAAAGIDADAADAAAAVALTGLAVVHRLGETRMHGGVAGGLRVPTEAEAAQWWRCLLTDDLNVRPAGDGWLVDEALESWSQTLPPGPEGGMDEHEAAWSSAWRENRLRFAEGLAEWLREAAATSAAAEPPPEASMLER